MSEVFSANHNSTDHAEMVRYSYKRMEETFIAKEVKTSYDRAIVLHLQILSEAVDHLLRMKG